MRRWFGVRFGMSDRSTSAGASATVITAVSEEVMPALSVTTSRMSFAPSGSRTFSVWPAAEQFRRFDVDDAKPLVRRDRAVGVGRSRAVERDAFARLAVAVGNVAVRAGVRGRDGGRIDGDRTASVAAVARRCPSRSRRTSLAPSGKLIVSVGAGAEPVDGIAVDPSKPLVRRDRAVRIGRTPNRRASRCSPASPSLSSRV